MHKRFLSFFVLALALSAFFTALPRLVFPCVLLAEEPLGPATTGLRFEVTAARGLLNAPRDGRLLIVLGRTRDAEPREGIGVTGLGANPLLGIDVKGLAPGVTAVVDQNAIAFPLPNLARLPAGPYQVQAVFDYNPDLRLPDAPGNLYSESQEVVLDPARDKTVKLELTSKVPAEELPRDTDHVRYVKLRSELLTRFHGRPIYLRAAVILPRDFDKEPARRYPLRVQIGGFGTRYTEAGSMMAPQSGFRRIWLQEGTPRMLLLHLDGAGPLGDPYQVNSANNGPYGDAVTQELDPNVEKK